MGAIPRPKKHFTSRAESAATTALDVRCACQFFESDSLLPERINPVGSRPSSSQGNYSQPISTDVPQHICQPNCGPTETQADRTKEKPTMNGHKKSHLSTNGDEENQDPSLERDTIRQKDPIESVLLRRRSESTNKYLETIGRQRDPSTSSILRRRFSANSIQQIDPSKSTVLRKRMDSQGSLQHQSSTEEPVAKEPKINESTPLREPNRMSYPTTNAERFMLSRNTLQPRPSVELSDLYRETMTFDGSDRDDKPKQKIIDVGIIDLMTLGTSFIQKGETKKKKSKKDKGNDDIENEMNGSEEHLPTTMSDQSTYMSPSSSALVHIGQDIYIEEPGDQSAMNERPSRKDYPDRVCRSDDEDHGSVENVSTTLLPRDLREQSTISMDAQKASPEKSSSKKRFSQNIGIELQPNEAPAPSTLITQRDPSTSTMLRRRYGQNSDDHTDDMNVAEIPTIHDQMSSAIESMESKIVENKIDVADFGNSGSAPEVIVKTIVPTNPIRDKMDWIERTYNTR